MYFHTRVRNRYVIQRLFGGGLRRISSGYLFLSVMTVPDVRRDTDFGSTAFMIEMASSRSLGSQRMMHQPSEHWITRGSKGTFELLNLAISVSLVSDSSTVNAMYLLLPRLDLTTIDTPHHSFGNNDLSVRAIRLSNVLPQLGHHSESSVSSSPHGQRNVPSLKGITVPHSHTFPSTGLPQRKHVSLLDSRSITGNLSNGVPQYGQDPVGSAQVL